jgi:hypothetical protein
VSFILKTQQYFVYKSIEETPFGSSHKNLWFEPLKTYKKRNLFKELKKLPNIMEKSFYGKWGPEFIQNKP